MSELPQYESRHTFIDAIDGSENIPNFSTDIRDTPSQQHRNRGESTQCESDIKTETATSNSGNTGYVKEEDEADKYGNLCPSLVLIERSENAGVTSQADSPIDRKASYMCEMCHETFMKPYDLKKHLISVHKMHILTCSSCDGCQSMLPKGTDRKPYICDICGDKSVCVREYQLHITEAHPDEDTDCLKKPYKCHICPPGKCFAHPFFLKLHMTIHTGEKLYTCDICQKPLSTPAGLNEHKKTHSAEKPYTCEVCPKQFKSKIRLKDHMLNHTRPYACDTCGCGYPGMYELKEHQLVHTGEKPHKCNICDKCFRTTDMLRQHLSTHTNQRPHPCQKCGKQFKTAKCLHEHSKTHTGQYKVSCHVCNNTFSTPKNLKTHMLIHQGKKPYKCTVCEKGFTQACNLKTHMTTHTGEKPYVCDVCNVGFSHNVCLKAHKKKQLSKM